MKRMTLPVALALIFFGLSGSAAEAACASQFAQMKDNLGNTFPMGLNTDPNGNCNSYFSAGDGELATIGTTTDSAWPGTGPGTMIALLKALISEASQLITISGSLTNPSLNFTLPATTTAYTAGQLIANSATAGSVVVPSFLIATAGGGAAITRLRIQTNDTTSTAWGNQTVQVDLWTAPPTWTNGDRGTWSPATGTGSHLGTYVCVMSPEFGDGAYAECSISIGNFANVETGVGILGVLVYEGYQRLRCHGCQQDVDAHCRIDELMKLFRALGLAGALLAQPCAAQMQTEQLLLNNTGWAFPGAYSDMDFANGRYYRPVQFTTTRSQTNSAPSTAQDQFGNWLSFAANTLRQTSRGVLIEEGRTNALRNAIGTGSTPGVLGAGGALPTNWSISFGTTGLTNANVTIGTPITDPTGVQLIPITINGTATAAGIVSIVLDNGSSTANAGNGQTYTGSIFDEFASGTLSGAQSALEVDGLASGTFVAGGIGASYTLPSSLTRETSSYTLVGSSTTVVNQVRFVYRVSLGNGATPNFTFNLGWPQIENNPNTSAVIASGAVNAAGSGYTGTSGTMTWSGGGCSTNPVLNVTALGGIITGVSSIANVGSCTSLPNSSATTWTPGGGLAVGSGATFTLTPVDNSAKGFVTSPILTQGTATSARGGDYVLINNPQVFQTIPLWMYWAATPIPGSAGGVMGGVANALTFANSVRIRHAQFHCRFFSIACVGCGGTGGSSTGNNPTIGSLNKMAAAWYSGASSQGGFAALNGTTNTNSGNTTFPTLADKFCDARLGTVECWIESVQRLHFPLFHWTRHSHADARQSHDEPERKQLRKSCAA